METKTITEKLEKIEELILQQSLQEKTLFNIDELVIYAGFSKLYIYKLTSQNKIPFYKPNGKHIFFKKTEIDEWLLNNRQSTIDEIESEAINYSVNKISVK